jgi:anti-sigma factor RsiW
MAVFRNFRGWSVVYGLVSVEHLDADLSAFLDGELGPAERARAEAHLSGCLRCQEELRQLQTTAALLGRLPPPQPRRALVPRVAERFNWLRPLRSLSAVSSGAFLFLFLASSVLWSGSGLGGGGTFAQPGAGPAAPAAPAAGPQASPAEGARSLPARGSPERLADQLATATPAAPAGAHSPAPRERDEAAPAVTSAEALERQRIGPHPLIYLVLAALGAAIALIAHRRLRAAQT